MTWRMVTMATLLACGPMLTGCGSSSPRTSPADMPAVAETPLQDAADTCDAGIVADSGETLMVDTKGEDDTTGESMEDLICLLFALETPTAVIDHMSSTRALDGMQTNNWDQFNARWTYHPDDGMGLTITLAD